MSVLNTKWAKENICVDQIQVLEVQAAGDSEKVWINSWALRHGACAHRDAEYCGAEPEGSLNVTVLQKHWDAMGYSLDLNKHV